MALARFKAAVDYVAGHAKAFGNNTGWIQAVTLVDSTGADASATLPTGAATETTLAAASAKLPASLGIKTAANSLSVAPASDASFVTAGNVASGAADSGNPIKTGGLYTTSPPTLTTGQRGDVLIDSSGSLLARLSIGNGTAGTVTSVNGSQTDGTSNTIVAYKLIVRPEVYNGSTHDRMPGNTTGTFTVAKGTTTGGLSPARVLTGTSGVLKGSAGQLYKLHSVRNANAAVRYLHLYDKATAPTLSTDTPVLTISLLASSIQNDIDVGGDIGVAFANGISWAYTTDNIAIPTAAGTSTELMFSAAYK